MSPGPGGSRGGLVLAGDVGGTKTALGLFRLEGDGSPPALVRSATFRSASYPGLEPIIGEMLPRAELAGVRGAAFGVAGPVIGNRCATTNLPWEISGEAIERLTGIPVVTVLNDLEATAEGIPALAEGDLLTLAAGAEGMGRNRVLIAAGTGLGTCLMPWVDGRWVPIPSEGGHVEFAPRDADEERLWHYLRERLGGRVSVERVVSGPGLKLIHDFLRSVGFAPGRPEVEEEMAAGDPSRVIAEAGLARACPLAERALDLFVSAYGAAAGNLALVGMALGGVYIGGGVAPKILPRLLEGPFMESFLAKGRFRSVLARMPVRVILNERAALLGAARYAARHRSEVAA